MLLHELCLTQLAVSVSVLLCYHENLVLQSLILTVAKQMDQLITCSAYMYCNCNEENINT